jgi:uncharacterized protein
MVENPLRICYFETMAVHLVIDGYNLIGAMTIHDNAKMDLKDTRDELIKRLMAYKRLKGCRITVVFDGKKSGSLSRDGLNQGGIKIRFSKDGEEADQILKEMAAAERHGMTLVTSDRAVVSFAEACGAVAIPSEEFDGILSMAMYSHVKGLTDGDEEGDMPTKKSGNPKKLSKQERKRLQRIKKL